MKALLFGVMGFLILGALAILYMADVGAQVMLAVIDAVTPPGG